MDEERKNGLMSEFDCDACTLVTDCSRPQQLWNVSRKEMEAYVCLENGRPLPMVLVITTMLTMIIVMTIVMI